MTDNNALVLEILKHDNQLSMSIFEKEETASTLKHYSQISVSLTEISKFCLEITSILNKTDKNGILETDSINSLRKTGQLLWDQLFTGFVKDRLKTTRILDLVLFLDEELINIPWELLYTGEDFLCLRFNVGRLVRTKAKPNPLQYRSLSGRLKMLILANPTNDLKSAYLEGISIKNQFDRIRGQFSIDFKSTQINTLYIKKNLRDYDIVHFAGHCEYDPDEARNSGWLLSDGILSVSDILKLGETLNLPTLIFSNACRSAQVKADLIDQDYQAKTYSLASAFLFSGVRHYIGTIRKIEDPISLTFAKEFYNHLIAGRPVGECMRLSRLSLIKEYGIMAIPWASYLLYGDPNFILFKSEHKPVIRKFKRNISSYKKRIKRIALAASIISIGICLYLWLPTINPNTYVLFLRSQRLFSKGRNQEVISICSRIIQKEPTFLSVYPLLADTYQRLGRSDTALKYYFEYARHSEKRQDKKNLSSAYTGIGWIYQSQGEYPKAFDFYNKAINLSRENKDKLNEAIALRKLAVWFIDKQEYDKALELLTKTSEINRQRQYVYGHRYNLACDYFDIGLVFINKDDLGAAREFYTKSSQLFEKLGSKFELSDYYFNLGEVCLFQKQYQKALDFYTRGLKIDKEHGNIPSIAADYNMIGELYEEMDNLAEAERFFNEAIEICQKIEAPMELASAYYNLGILYKKKGKLNRAREYFRWAQEIYSRIDTPDYSEVKEELLSLY